MGPEQPSQEVYVFLAIFARLGSILMLMPVFGEISVSPRVRLAMALAITVVLTPVVASHYPPLPATPFDLGGLIVGEILIGLFIGVSARLVLSALQTAGTVLAFQTGLGFAQSLDPTQGVQSALIGTFLTLTGLTLIVVTDLHHLLLGALRGSYAVFMPGKLPAAGDMATLVTGIVASTFLLAIQISAPFLVFGLVFYLAAGVISKLMPQIQIFFVAIPVNIVLGLGLLMLCIGAIMTWFLEHLQAQIAPWAG